jgi:hypothetical protein
VLEFRDDQSVNLHTERVANLQPLIVHVAENKEEPADVCLNEFYIIICFAVNKRANMY